MKKRDKIWLWTWKMYGDSGQFAIEEALRLGYRSFDLAWIYQNAEMFSAAWKKSWIPREELFFTSKVWFDYVPNYEKHRFIKSDFFYSLWDERFDCYLEQLGVGYLDEVLLHWPTWEENDLMMLASLDSLKKKGKIMNIGVANFPLWYLKQLFPKLPCSLSANQIEMHPCLMHWAMLEFLQEQKMDLVAYSPLGHGNVLNNPTLQDIAIKYKVSVAQICIAWCLSKGVFVIPKASSSARLQENLAAEHLFLMQGDIEKIDQLPKHYRYCNPPFALSWD